jgi:hypothetical protein
VPSSRSAIRIPEGWVVDETHRVGPFITRQRYRLPDGSHLTWNSRRHRKVGHAEERQRRVIRPWWQPGRLGWWIAVLFMVGSFLFGLGSFPPYADHVAASTVAVTYFVGSIFFTSAGYLQYLQTINTRDDFGDDGSSTERLRFFAWQPRRIDWWAASAQSVGTLLFNISTYSAMNTAFSQQQQERLVWAPDMFGSIAFMIASTLAWLEVCHGWWAWRPRDIAWKIVAFNLAGSIAFQISAIAAFIEPSTGELVSLPIANLGTFVGAIGFFFGALLLIPEFGDHEPLS